MSLHRRSFHLHLTHESENPGMIRWSVSRTVWAAGTQTRSATLATGWVGDQEIRETPLLTFVAAALAALGDVTEQCEQAHDQRA